MHIAGVVNNGHSAALDGVAGIIDGVTRQARQSDKQITLADFGAILADAMNLDIAQARGVDEILQQQPQRDICLPTERGHHNSPFP